jgi:hypothetical protein
MAALAGAEWSARLKAKPKSPAQTRAHLQHIDPRDQSWESMTPTARSVWTAVAKRLVLEWRPDKEKPDRPCPACGGTGVQNALLEPLLSNIVRGRTLQLRRGGALPWRLTDAVGLEVGDPGWQDLFDGHIGKPWRTTRCIVEVTVEVERPWSSAERLAFELDRREVRIERFLDEAHLEHVPSGLRVRERAWSSFRMNRDMAEQRLAEAVAFWRRNPGVAP